MTAPARYGRDWDDYKNAPFSFLAPQDPPENKPAFDRLGAAGGVGAQLHEDGELGALIVDVADSWAVLDWIASNVTIPVKHLHDFRALLRQANALDKAVRRELNVLNGEVA